MRNHRFEDKATITAKLGDYFDCKGSNLVITRNTTESLDLIISGFAWQAGDHAIHAIQDYGAMQDMFAQIAERHTVEVTSKFPIIPKTMRKSLSFTNQKLLLKQN